MEHLLEVDNVEISFSTEAGTVRAIRGVSFHIDKGETLAIVGESGSGKSVISRATMGLLASNGQIDNGSIKFDGQEVSKMSEKELVKIRGSKIAMIFQDPMTALNPLMTIGKQIMEGVKLHQGSDNKTAYAKALELIKLVGISEPEMHFKQYPHQFSGGMRQRIVIAIALSCNPEILIADEPTTALDVTIQAQILELIKDIQKETGVGIIFITHDLGVVANMADRIAVMYAGKIVETGLVDEIFYNPQHPYTWGLLASMPSIDAEDETLFAIPGTPPNLLYPPKGDAFAPRNKWALDIDFEMQPPMFKVNENHYAATWLLDPRAPKVDVPEIVLKRVRQHVEGGEN